MSIHSEVENYYGEELQGSDDLKTNACCTLTKPPLYIREALNLVADEVQDKYYGCGLTIPSHVSGLKILDLGSGSGRDCYIASKLVGEQGTVIGVDMTDNQFSNCVINLAVDKQKVLNDAFKLLKPGGEMYFSDVYSDRRVPVSLQKDRVLWGECISGALYWNDFLNFSKHAGFTDPRVVESKPITVENEALEMRIRGYNFFSVTYRLFKIDGLESDCEDYGQAVVYKGTIEESPANLMLDDHHDFPTGKMMTVCGNTYKMLHDTRYNAHFEFYGNWDTHYGIFEGCGGNMPFSVNSDAEGAACC